MNDGRVPLPQSAHVLMPVTMMLRRPFILQVVSLAMVPFLLSCGRDGSLDPVDRKGLSREDYRDMYDKRQEEEERNEQDSSKITIPEGAKVTATTKAPPIPSIASILAAPRPPKIGETKLVSIAVTDDVPLKDVFVELSRLADVDIEVDSGIEGGITFRAKERPFNEVVERVADMAGLRYSFKGGILRIERDLPFIRNYSIDFLNLTRDLQSTYSISTDVTSSLAAAAGSGGSGGGEGGGGGGSSGGGGVTSGSTSAISSRGEDDFWNSLGISITNILMSSPPKYAAMNPLDPRAAAELGEGAAASVAPGTTTLPSGNSFNVNRKAGVISVSATERQHEKVNAFIEKIRQNSSAQVLIEAKILEVQLDDNYKSGINWDQINTGGPVTWDNVNIRGRFTNTFPESEPFIQAQLIDKFGRLDIDATITLAEQFGTVRTLSSPRLNAINNQPAVLTFARNRVFFNLNVQVTPSTTSEVGRSEPQTSITSEVQTVPIGIILNILPSIDLRHNEVTLSVRPTLTRVVNEVDDPALPLQIASLQATAERALPTELANKLANATNKIPIVEVRELDSIMKVKSGQVMVIGGLMENTSTNTEGGVPYADEVPIFGNLFKNVTKSDTNKELVIFIKATIVSPGGDSHETDRKLYHKFTDDPRPLAF